MVGKRNGMIPNVHLHKNWKRWVRTYFDEPMRKKRRATRRADKARKIAPRPLASLRPVVRCPRNKHNHRERLGRGFTLEELAGAGMNKKWASTVGIAVDYRRKNRNVEGLQQNVQRLKEYKSKLILFPRKASKPREGDASEEERKMATQHLGPIMPIDRTQPQMELRAPTEEEKKFKAYVTLRTAWRDAKNKGYREKKARDAAEASK